MSLDTAEFCYTGSRIGWVSALLYYDTIRLAMKQVTVTD